MGGAASTIFWIDPEEELVAVAMTQVLANTWPLRETFSALVYQSIDVRFLNLSVYLMFRKIIPVLTIVFISFGIQSNSNLPIIEYNSINHPVISKTGMVVSQRQSASEVGAEILRKGGNAVDAAVATGLALAVVLPRAGNLGGGGFMVVYLKDKDKTITIDYRERAPSAAHRDLF